MNKNSTKIIASVALVLAFVFYFLNFSVKVNAGSSGTPTTEAIPAHSITGQAWSSNIGWINLSCDTDPLGCGGPGGNYGVDVIGQLGFLSGWAWSSNIGWIKFDSGYIGPNGGQAAKVDASGNLSGWARACAGINDQAYNQNVANNTCGNGFGDRTDGWDGWISLSSTTGVTYGAKLGLTGSTGQAWGSDVVGWLDFTNVQYTPPSSTVTLQANSSNGPITVASGTPFILSWNSTSVSACSSKTAVPAVTGWTNATPAITANTPGTTSLSITNSTGAMVAYTFTLSCTATTGATPAAPSATLTVNVSSGLSGPIVTAFPATGISMTSATLSGKVVTNGITPLALSFDYSTDPNMTTFNNLNSPPNSTSAASANFNMTINGLTPGTTYYYRAVAKDITPTFYRDTSTAPYKQFTTYAIGQPIVNTLTPTPSASGATLKGYVDPNGSGEVPLSLSFEYSTDPAMVSPTPISVAGSPSSTPSGAMIFNASVGLTTGTTYYYRAVATGSTNTKHYGNIVSFTAVASPTVDLKFNGADFASVVAGSVGALTWTSTNMAANGISTCTITPSVGSNFWTGAPVNSTSPIVVGPINSAVMYTINCGSAADFVTVSIIPDPLFGTPIIKTKDASALGQTSAQLNGLFDPNGLVVTQANPMILGFQYGTDINNLSTSMAAVPLSPTSYSNFTAALTGLTSDTTYYYKAVGTFGSTPYEGAIKTFNTASPTSTLTLNVAPNYILQPGLANLVWTSTNVYSCVADSVDINGDPNTDWYNLNSSGIADNGSQIVNVGSSTMFTLTCNATYGSSSTIKAQAGVQIGTDPVPGCSATTPAPGCPGNKNPKFKEL